jgi:hypothetical protein
MPWATESGARRIQPEREFRSNKFKQKQGKGLSFPFIGFLLFFRIDTFQWVTSEK